MLCLGQNQKISYILQAKQTANIIWRNEYMALDIYIMYRFIAWIDFKRHRAYHKEI